MRARLRVLAWLLCAPLAGGTTAQDVVVSVSAGVYDSVRADTKVALPEGMSAEELEGVLRSPALLGRLKGRLEEALHGTKAMPGHIEFSDVTFPKAPAPALKKRDETSTKAPAEPEPGHFAVGLWMALVGVMLLLAVFVAYLASLLLCRPRPAKPEKTPPKEAGDLAFSQQEPSQVCWRFGRIVAGGRPPAARLDGAYDFEFGRRPTEQRQLNLTAPNAWRMPPPMPLEDRASSSSSYWRSRPGALPPLHSTGYASLTNSHVGTATPTGSSVADDELGLLAGARGRSLEWHGQRVVTNS